MDDQLERPGRVPSRVRKLPHKLRDYENSLLIKDEIIDDEDDYIPQESVPVRKKKSNHNGNGSELISEGPNPNACHTSSNKQKNITEKILQLGPGVVDDLLSAKRGRPNKGQEKSTDADKWHECHICLKKFSVKGNFKQHLLTHTDKKPFTCDYKECNKSFRTKETCQKHMLAHEGIKPFSCEMCHQGFTTNQALKEHRARHTDTKLYKCSVCHKHFRQVSCLSRHMVIHSGEKKYSCNTCGKRFAQPAYLRSHKRTHTGEKRFSCELCGKVFGYRSDLNRHAIIHNGTRPYQCSICNQRFNDRSSCRRHLRNHTDEKGYICEMCGNWYNQIAQLENHVCTSNAQLIRSTVHSIVNKGNTACVTVQNECHTGIVEDNQEAIDLQNVQDQIQQVLIQLQEARQIQTGDESGINIHIITIPDSEEVTTEQVKLGTIDIQPASLFGEETPTEGLNDSENLSLSSDLGFITCLPDNSCADDGSNNQISNTPVDMSCESEKTTPMCSENTPVNTNRSSFHNPSAQENKDSVTEIIPDNNPQNFTSSKKEICKPSIEADEGTLSLLADLCEPEKSKLDFQRQYSMSKNVSQKSLDVDNIHSAVIDSDYVKNPQFSSPEYFSWLSNFVTFCKTLSIPLNVDTYHKINHVCKVLSDVMGNVRPNGTVLNKDNFQNLMTITTDLNSVIYSHMNYVLNQLNDDSTNT